MLSVTRARKTIMRCFLLLLATCLLNACGIKGALEKPANPPPPSLYERIFGEQAPERASDAPKSDAANAVGEAAE
ncbi:MAG: hypothetical protein LBD68_11525 [Zoogloeaceae bacterium]|nr:hypothetical protein [Zoogloeaceae bacterium]